MLALKWALRDLRGGLRGLRLLFGCLLVGVFAIAGVGSLSQAIITGLEEQGQSILGGDLEVELSQMEATPEQQAAFARLGQVSAIAEVRAMARTPDGRSQLVELRAVDNAYPLYGTITFAPGGAETLQQALASRSGTEGSTYGAAVSADLAGRLNLKPGDALEFGDGKFHVGAILAEEPDRVGRGFIFGSSVLVSREALLETGLAQPGSIVDYEYRIRLPQGAGVEAAKQALTEAFPDAQWRVRDRTDGAPRLRRTVEQLSQFLTLVGLTALLVAGVGVANGVSAYLARKTGTIATLKSLGAPSALVFQIYLLQIAVVTLAAIVAGLALGALVPGIAGQLLAEQLPVPPASGLFPKALLLGAGYGLLTAIIFALWPLAQARRIPAARLFRAGVERLGRPDAATLTVIIVACLLLAVLAVWGAADRKLAAGFVVAAVAVLALLRGAGGLLERLAARAPRFKSPVLRTAVANLHRPGNTAGQVVMAMGLGLSLFAAIAVIESNLNAQIRSTLPEKAPAFFFLDIQPHEIDTFKDALRSTPGTGAIETVPSLRGPIVRVNDVPADQVKADPEVAWVLRGDRGLSYAEDVPEGNVVTEGDWWTPDYAGPPLVSLDEEVARGLGMKIGDTITVSVLGVELTATLANMRKVDWDSLGFNFAMLFNPAALQGAPHTYMATVEATKAAEPTVYERITGSFPAVLVVRVSEALEQVGALMAQISVAVRAMGAITIAAGILVLIGSIVASRQARSYDAVLLKLLGATRGQVLAGLVLEYALIGVLTAAIALVLGLLGGWFAVTRVLDLEWVLPLGPAFGTVLVGAIATLVMGLAGTWRVLSVRPNQVLRAAQT
ncbi:MAG TPA: FtsX-like permease family protein [Pedomonas sp.]|uniref:ABC transporter permease n=1 Tax=Pedomonas sp. TaxID=2976421 RepID=UPI002F3F7B9B